ncbi:MAG TPA: hypothetical protein VGG66_08875, partial [Rhizomicrobium sp.]
MIEIKDPMRLRRDSVSRGKVSMQEPAMETGHEVMNSTRQGMHSRRALMRKAGCAVGGILAAMAATPAQAKMSQKVAEYQATPKGGQSC